jgi:hypothetical protein
MARYHINITACSSAPKARRLPLLVRLPSNESITCAVKTRRVPLWPITSQVKVMKDVGGELDMAARPILRLSTFRDESSSSEEVRP